MSNITDPNKLASKHTPGPWKFVHQAHATRKSGLGMRYGVFADVINHEKRDVDRWLFNIRLDRTEDLDIHQEAEANAHLISAAPEMVEFIADIVHMMSSSNFPQGCIDAFIKSGEEILKKAYNF